MALLLNYYSYRNKILDFSTVANLFAQRRNYKVKFGFSIKYGKTLMRIIYYYVGRKMIIKECDIIVIIKYLILQYINLYGSNGYQFFKIIFICRTYKEYNEP
jgi:hypothetical protein